MQYIIVEDEHEPGPQFIATETIYSDITLAIERATELAACNNRQYAIYTLGQEIT